MGFLLLVPFLLIRFGLLFALGKTAVRRAAYFAPLQGKERVAYWFYLVSNLAIFGYTLFVKIRLVPRSVFLAGLGVFLLGNLLLIASVVSFARPGAGGVNQRGVYRFSRNPMYVAYFVYFLGCALLAHSWVLLGIVLVFQVSSHWIILSEERWCTAQFGEEYTHYTQRVRRYL